MQRSLLRIPYTGPLPAPPIIPTTAATPGGALAALRRFLVPDSASPPLNSAVLTADSTPIDSTAVGSTSSDRQFNPKGKRTVLLTGAGLSVASGLADYRGEQGTYTLNRTYRPIYYHEFVASHAARQRYWARSFLGWLPLHRARPNASHHAIARLGQLGLVTQVITQNVDSFHPRTHPHLPTIELHGYLRHVVCIHCQHEMSRDLFQESLSRLNPAWAGFLADMVSSGALDTENPAERRRRGLKTNPDGDVDLPDAPFTTFRYPACPKCLANPPILPDGRKGSVKLDNDGAWSPSSLGGVLKPAVVMFGESIAKRVKGETEHAVDEANRMLVIGSSLATYSAWRLVKRAKDRGLPIGIVNMGGARGEEAFFADVPDQNQGETGLRCSYKAEEILPQLIEALGGSEAIGRSENGLPVPFEKVSTILPSFGRME